MYKIPIDQFNGIKESYNLDFNHSLKLGADLEV